MLKNGTFWRHKIIRFARDNLSNWNSRRKSKCAKQKSLCEHNDEQFNFYVNFSASQSALGRPVVTENTNFQLPLYSYISEILSVEWHTSAAETFASEFFSWAKSFHFKFRRVHGAFLKGILLIWPSENTKSFRHLRFEKTLLYRIFEHRETCLLKHVLFDYMNKWEKGS